jgi:hypothetical protein
MVAYCDLELDEPMTAGSALPPKRMILAREPSQVETFHFIAVFIIVLALLTLSG